MANISDMGTRTTALQPGRQRLRDWVDRSKFDSDRQAAEILGVHPVVLSQWMSGARRPDLDNALLIERVTGISVESWQLTEMISADEGRSAGAVRAK